MRRLLLFDVDGTLVSTSGRAGHALAEALGATFGVTVCLAGYHFSGKTDPLIVRELMAAAGYSEQTVSPHLDEVFAAYLARLDQALGPDAVRVLSGVRELLDNLQTRTDVALGLLTGNIRQGAELKLRRARLWSYFEIGAFGSDSEDRNQLVAVARERAMVHWGHDFRPEDTVVIGDAAADVHCARAGGARAVVVATGGTPIADLARLRPDALLESLVSPDTLPALLEGAA